MEIQMEAVMANNYTNKYTLVFKGPVPSGKLTANGTVKTFGVGGPNVLDMIGD